MKALIFGILVFSLLTLAACSQTPVESQQSIQDILAKTGSYNTTQVPKIEQKPLANLTENKTKEEVKPPEMIMNRKCRNSAIMYGGCKWTDNTQTKFTVKIQSSSKLSIYGVWFVITGESGGIKKTYDDGEILSKGTKTYTIDYTGLVKELGEIKKVELFPTEMINETNYACLNQQAPPFIPKTHCKPAEAVRLNPDGSINQSG